MSRTQQKKGLSSAKSHHPELGSESPTARLQVCCNSGGHSGGRRGLRKEMKLIKMHNSFLATLNGWTEQKDRFQPIPFLAGGEVFEWNWNFILIHRVCLESPALGTLGYYRRLTWAPWHGERWDWRERSKLSRLQTVLCKKKKNQNEERQRLPSIPDTWENSVTWTLQLSVRRLLQATSRSKQWLRGGKKCTLNAAKK